MFAVAALLATLATASVPPAPERWVEDHAALMSELARRDLDARLEAYEHATGHQVVLWIGKTLDGAPLDDWAVRTFAAWKLGRAGKDDGVAIFVLADDRAIDIEVGYGLEDKVPDAVASRIIREVMTPALRARDPDGAMRSGTDAVLAAIEGHPWDAVAPAGAPTAADEPLSLASWIAIGVGAVLLLILFVTHPRSALWLLWIAGRSWGFGGGGDGGAFGGRGGKSGGGGARGKW